MPEADGLLLHELTIRYWLDGDGPRIELVQDDDDDLVTLLGMIRLAEDTLIRVSMGEA